MRVMIALSGGVDSAVAAYCLLEQGYTVEALFMKNWEEDDTTGYCAAAIDLADAQAVANRLGIHLHTVNFATEYWEQVFEIFLSEYRALRTPNPDIWCNRDIKFTAFLEHAHNLGAELIATGHYAHITHDNTGYQLRCAADSNKDQTYFLHLLNQYQLAHSLFPLHDVNKAKVRAIAQNLGLTNANKKDSTGICFIGEKRFREFLARYLSPTPGPIETLDGHCIGEHQGLAYYTLGQRQGLGIGGITGKSELPWFIAIKDIARNALIVVQDSQHPLLMSNTLQTGPVHWIAAKVPAIPLQCYARLRHRQPLQNCTITFINQDYCQVHFLHAQRAITPGQSIVFYQDDICLGGAVIEYSDIKNC